MPSIYQLQSVTGRDLQWIKMCLKVLKIEHQSGMVSQQEAVRIIAESERCSEKGMMPGDPSIDEIYRRAAKIREKAPRFPVGFMEFTAGTMETSHPIRSRVGYGWIVGG